jgi:hypothetical protein
MNLSIRTETASATSPAARELRALFAAMPIVILVNAVREALAGRTAALPARRIRAI